MEQRTHETNPQPLDTALNESSMTFALQHEWQGATRPRGEIATLIKIGVAHEMESAFVTSPARSPTEMLYSMALSTGPSSFLIAVWAAEESAQSILVGLEWTGTASGPNLWETQRAAAGPASMRRV